MTTIVDPWSFLPFYILLLGSGLPFLYRSIGAPKGAKKGANSLGLQWLFFIAASFFLFFFFAHLFHDSTAFYATSPLMGLSLIRMLTPLLSLFVVGINWYKLVNDPNPRYLSVTLLVLGVVAAGPGSLIAIYMPLIMPGQSLSSYLFFFLIYPVLGLILIFTGIYIWMKKERFVELVIK